MEFSSEKEASAHILDAWTQLERFGGLDWERKERRAERKENRPPLDSPQKYTKRTRVENEPEINAVEFSVRSLSIGSFETPRNKKKKTFSIEQMSESAEKSVITAMEAMRSLKCIKKKSVPPKKKKCEPTPP